MSKPPKNSPTLRRNGVAQAALNRKAPTMRHRNAGKGGQVNEQAALLEQAAEEVLGALLINHRLELWGNGEPTYWDGTTFVKDVSAAKLFLDYEYGEDVIESLNLMGAFVIVEVGIASTAKDD